MRSFSLLFFFLIISTTLKAEEIVKLEIPDALPTGTARLTYLFWDVYDATLYAPNGQWSEDKPFALTLAYLRSFEGKEIAKRSIQEIRKLGLTDEATLAGWYSQMKAIFPDVKAGTKLTGIYLPGEQTRFYDNDQEIGVIHDPLFGKWFFNIWLSEDTSEPALRDELVGKL